MPRHGDIDLPDGYEMIRKAGAKLTSFGLCRECFAKAMNDYYQKEDAGEKMLAYIIANEDESEYTSSGE